MAKKRSLIVVRPPKAIRLMRGKPTTCSPWTRARTLPRGGGTVIFQGCGAARAAVTARGSDITYQVRAETGNYFGTSKTLRAAKAKATRLMRKKR